MKFQQSLRYIVLYIYIFDCLKGNPVSLVLTFAVNKKLQVKGISCIILYFYCRKFAFLHANLYYCNIEINTAKDCIIAWG